MRKNKSVLVLYVVFTSMFLFWSVSIPTNAQIQSQIVGSSKTTDTMKFFQVEPDNITIDDGTITNATTDIIEAFVNIFWDFDKGTGIFPALWDYVPVFGKYGTQTLQAIFLLTFAGGVIIVMKKVK